MKPEREREVRFALRARAAPVVWWPFLVLALVSFAALAAALVSQHVYGMEPCAWCVLQRLIFLAIGLVAVIGLAVRGAAVIWPAAAVCLVLSLTGLAAALWQHFVAAQSASCNLTLADRIVSATRLDTLLPDVFAARASCADAAVSLVGVPYAFWAAAAFALCALLAFRPLRRAG